MSRKAKRKHEPGDIFFSEELGCRVEINEQGEEVPWAPPPYEMFPDPPKPDSLDDLPRRADGSISPFYQLTEEQLERLGQPTARQDARRPRHDGWTIERQKNFIETLAATASVVDACRYVGLSKQSANKLYGRSPQFRAAWDDALKASVGVLAATAFDRAVNGTQEQVWHNGRMIGFREKHHDRLLIYLLRVRDPLNYAPLDDLAGWQRHRALEQGKGDIAPVLDRLEAAERAWAEAGNEAPRLAAPDTSLPDPSTESISSTSPRAPDPPTESTSSTSPDASGNPKGPDTPCVAPTR